MAGTVVHDGKNVFFLLKVDFGINKGDEITTTRHVFFFFLNQKIIIQIENYCNRRDQKFSQTETVTNNPQTHTNKTRKNMSGCGDFITFVDPKINF